MASLLILLAAAATARPIGRSADRWPANVHPAVVQQVQAHPGDLMEVIVNKAHGAIGVEEGAEQIGGEVTSRWTMINAFAVKIPGSRVATLARLPGVRAVLHNNQVEPTGQESPSGPGNAYPYAVGADRAWEEGYTGAGVTIAIVDTGISAADPSPSDFGNRVIARVSLHEDATSDSDTYGHGTHVAGIAAGDGRNSSGRYSGIAPGANLISVKFSDDQGNATERDLLNALQWVYDNRDTYNIRVVNISATVSLDQSYTESPTSAAAEQLWFAGVVVVAAAGNRGGQSCATCAAPGHDPFVITVGAVDDNGTKLLRDDFMTPWSSYGKTKDKVNKPDIVAPGARIISYMPAGVLREMAPENAINSDYFRMGGTSMSAPVVSGAIALLLEARPNLTPDQVKGLITSTARPYKNQINHSPGILDVGKSLTYNGRSLHTTNNKYKPSPLLSTGSNTIDYSNTLWGNTLWGNTLWAHSFNY
jgi:serine protease AprX